MRPLALFASVVAGLVTGVAPARAQESLDDIPGANSTANTGTAPPGTGDTASAPRSTKTVEVNGYADNRFSYTLVNPDASPVSTADVPSLTDLLEANVQLKVHLGEKAFIYGDASLFLQGGWLFYSRAPGGGRQDADADLPGNLPPHDRPSLRPFAVASELYVSYSPKSWLNLLAGKKRIVWGSGVAFNPTDLINPAKDPTDPNLQRAGAWVARVELPFEKFTFSVLFAPSVLYQTSGLPSRFLSWPDYPSQEQRAGLAPDLRDDASHYLLAARLYALLWDTDVNLIYYFSNKYQDQFTNKSRVGVSLSRYFLTDYELHVEALLQTGTSRPYVNHACATGGYCPNPLAALSYSKIDDGYFHPRVLAGFRTTFRDESMLSLEYLYQGDGDSDLEFEDRIHALVKASQLQSLGLVPSGALPVRFGFDPLRRHYLIASWNKPKIHDDWAIGVVMLAGLRDLSALISPSVTWSAREWLTLSLWGYVPIRGIPVGEAQVDGRGYSEFGLLPFDFRAMFEARAFY